MFAPLGSEEADLCAICGIFDGLDQFQLVEEFTDDHHAGPKCADS